MVKTCTPNVSFFSFTMVMTLEGLVEVCFNKPIAHRLIINTG